MSLTLSAVFTARLWDFLVQDDLIFGLSLELKDFDTTGKQHHTSCHHTYPQLIVCFFIFRPQETLIRKKTKMATGTRGATGVTAPGPAEEGPRTPCDGV